MSISIYLSIYLSIYIYVYIGGWFSSKSRYITGNICTYMPEYNMVQYNTMEQIIFQHNITQSNYIYIIHVHTYIHTYTHNIPARQTRNEGTCKAGPGRRGRHKERQNERERERQRQTERATVTTKTKHRVSYTQYPLQQLTSHVHAKTINNMQEHHNTHTLWHWHRLTD